MPHVSPLIAKLMLGLEERSPPERRIPLEAYDRRSLVERFEARRRGVKGRSGHGRRGSAAGRKVRTGPTQNSDWRRNLGDWIDMENNIHRTHETGLRAYLAARAEKRARLK